MSRQMLSYQLFLNNKQKKVAKQWMEIQKNVGENESSMAVIQLIMECLMQSCGNADSNSFRLPTGINLMTFDLKTFINIQIVGKTFDSIMQQDLAKKLSILFQYLVQYSDDAVWMRFLRVFFREMAQHRETVLLISPSIVSWFFGIAKLMSDPLVQTFKSELESTCEHLSFTIQKHISTHSAFNIIANEFCDKIKFKLNLNVFDQEGCLRIIVKFLSYEDDKINILALTTISKAMNNRNGRKMIELCCTKDVINALQLLITNRGNIKLIHLAYMMAINIQKQPCNQRKKLFSSDVFKKFLIEGNAVIQRSAAELFHLTFYGGDSAEFLVILINFQMKYRFNYTTCTRSLVNAFRTIFDLSDWKTIFRVLKENAKSESFSYELFTIVNIVLKIMKTENPRDSEKFKSFEYLAIDFLIQLDKRYVYVHASTLRWIYGFDSAVNGPNDEYRRKFAHYIEDIYSNYFSKIDEQTVALTICKSLVEKKFVKKEDIVKHIENQFNDFVGLLQHYGVETKSNVDFETIPDLMKSTFNLAMLVRYFNMENIKTAMFQQSYKLVVDKPLDLHQNRSFLAYCIIIMVESSIAHNVDEIQSDIIRKVTRRLVEILQQTENNIHILCDVVLASLCQMECKFTQNRTSLRNLQILPDYVFRQIELLPEAIRQKIWDFNFSIQRMLIPIGDMLRMGKELDVEHLLAKLFKEFPYPHYGYTLHLFRDLAQRPTSSLFVDCVLAIFNSRVPLEEKKVFASCIKKIIEENMVEQNQNGMKEEFKNKALAMFGKAKRDTLRPRARQIAESAAKLISVEFKPWFTPNSNTNQAIIHV